VSFATILLGVLKGAGVTIGVTLLALCYAFPFAVMGGVLQYYLRGPGRAAVTVLIEFWRSSSVVILLFVFFYVLPVIRIDLSPLSVSALVLGLNIGAYGTQAVRGALQVLDDGQLEAGLALGMSRPKVLLLVELPQIVRPVLPNFINLLVQLMKATALVSLVTLSDMTFRAKEINQLSYQPVRVYTALLLSYFVICYPVALIGRLVERRQQHVSEAGHAL
jgi:polar amino acid transport system permease protein